MIKHITEILIDNGFVPHRRMFVGDKLIYQPCAFDNTYSSLVSGHLDYVFKRNNDTVVWGLNERHKPPTLKYPRDFIFSELARINNVVECGDDAVNQYLDKIDHNELFKKLECQFKHES